MSQRIVQINGLLKKEVSGILLKSEGFDRNTLITITRVETSQDLGGAKVFVSVLPSEKSRQILDFLRENIYHIQQELNHRLCLKRVPKIIFYPETKTAEAGRIEELIEKIHKKDNGQVAK